MGYMIFLPYFIFASQFSMDRCQCAELKAEVRQARAEAKLDACGRRAMVEAQRFQANQMALSQFGRVHSYVPGGPSPFAAAEAVR
jgi:hypothetical protein